MKTIINDISQLSAAAAALLKEYDSYRIFALKGDMGAGKTTFIKELCSQLGSSDHVVSPTFSIVNEYLTPEGETIFHFDFYRLEKIQEAFDIGIEEYLTGDRYCFIEWPEKIEEILPPETVRVYIEVTDTTARVIESQLSSDI